MSFSQLRHTVLALLFTGLAACSMQPLPMAPPVDRDSIATGLMRDITTLSSDSFGGRMPGTDGEIMTVGFLIDEMRLAGLTSGTNDPGNPWRAPVQMVTTEPNASTLTIKRGRRDIVLDAEQAVAYTSRRRTQVEAPDMLFVGRLSDSVDGAQISGKVLVMLGEPGVSPARRETLFESDPAAIITVVDTTDEVEAVRNLNSARSTFLASDDSNRLTGFVTTDEFAAAIGADRWNELEAAAGSDRFEPVTLERGISIEASSERREFTSNNVIGRLAGQVPGSGAVLLMAHWDHLGECGDPGGEDLICNGAVDNASGLAVMLELARRLVESGPHDRDIYFMGTTGEELGLLGVRAFVAEPAVPLDSIVAAFNFDSVAIAPAGTPVGFVGEGQTSLDGIINQVLSDTGRELGNQSVADQFLQRQDAWALLQQGVPAVVLSSAFGSDIALNSYLAERYHLPSDEIERIELGGAIDDLLLHEELIVRVADTELYPDPGG
jgi:hypothetical protein